MQSGEEGPNNNSVLDKDTLQVSPHIAAHKSSPSIANIPFITDNGISDSQLQSRLIAIPNNAIYKLNISVPTAHGDLSYTIKSPNSVVHGSNTLPEDLSPASGKAASTTIETTTKLSTQAQSVISQAVDGFTGSLIMSDRTPTFYNIVDGTTVTINGQHQTVFVSSINGDNEIFRCRTDDISVPNFQITSSMESGATHHELATLSYQPGIQDGQLTVPEIPGSIIWEDQDIKKLIKNEDEAEQKDLVRQALQAAVAHSSPRIGTEDLLGHEYNCNDCIPEDGICHSTFSVQNKPQEILMMTGHLGTIQNDNKFIGSMGTILPTDIPNGTQVLVLQTPATAEAINSSTVDLTNRRRRPREVVQPRKKNVANRMKEKRANESDEQRKRRRSREAERMRKKRQQEDESTKQRRRHEAADKARKRRANLSPSERDSERKKAAQRMRARRLKENEDERKVRRDKAAERMRLRRAKETPEEKAMRRQGGLVKIKGKRKTASLKVEANNSHEEYIKNENNVASLSQTSPHHYETSCDSPSSFQNQNKDGRIKSVKMSKSYEHILLNSAPNNSSANFTFLSNDVIPNEGRFIHVSDFPETIPVEVRNLSPIESQRIPSISVSQTEHITVNKRIVTNQAPPSYMEAVSPVVVTEAQNDPMPLHKPSSAQLGIHHLPHLLHQQHLSTYPTIDHQYHHDQTSHAKNH